MATYSGPVVFVDGVHYPAVPDSNDVDPDTGEPRTHADLSRPLRWVEGDGGYRDAEAGDPLHNDTHHLEDLTLEPGSEG